MCRVLGSVAAEPVSVRNELLEAANPLIRPSNGDDGWGMACYPRAEGEDPVCGRFPKGATVRAQVHCADVETPVDEPGGDSPAGGDPAGQDPAHPDAGNPAGDTTTSDTADQPQG